MSGVGRKLPQIGSLFLRRLRAILPVPGLIEVRVEAETFSISHQPLVHPRVDLNRAVLIFSADRVAADIHVEREPGRMRTMKREPGAPRMRAALAELRLVSRRAVGRDDAEKMIRGTQLQRLIGRRRGPMRLYAA